MIFLFQLVDSLITLYHIRPSLYRHLLTCCLLCIPVVVHVDVDVDVDVVVS